MQPPPAGKRSELALSFKVLVPAALMFLLFIYFSYFVVLPLVENKMMEQRRQMLRSIGAAVWHLLDSYRQKAGNGEMTADAARSMALSMVKTFRFGAEGKDYCWISDLETVVLMHPYQPDLVGRRLAEHSRCVYTPCVYQGDRSRQGVRRGICRLPMAMARRSITDRGPSCRM